MLIRLNPSLARVLTAGLTFLTLGVGFSSIAQAAPSVTLASAEPAQVSVGQSTHVRFSADITDPSLIAGSINLERVGPAGTNPTIVGKLYDDGINGDAIAGDKRYSIEVTLNELTATQITYRISAAFKGVLQRVKSNNIIVAVLESRPPDAAPAASIELSPQAVLLTALGERKTLRATVRDANGQVIPGLVTYISNAPGIVSVSETGVVEAQANSGTALITANVGNVETQLYVFVATPVPGAQLLTDRQIVSGPIAVDPTVQPVVPNSYEVVLRGVPGIAVGSLLINTEARSVAGRVVDVQPQGSDQRVRLVTVPFQQLFSAFNFKDSVDLSKMPFETPADIAALYDVQRNGNTFTFTPKPSANFGIAPTFKAGNRSGAFLQKAAQGTVALPPLPPFGNCEAKAGFGSGLPLPLALSSVPAFAFDVNNATLDREVTPLGKKVILRGTPTFTFTTALEIRSAFEAKIECKATLKLIKVRVPGLLGALFGGDIEFGTGFEVGGKVTLVSAKVGGAAVLRTTMEFGLNCPVGADCALISNTKADPEITPVFEVPSFEQARFEPTVSLFGFVKAELGNADVEALQFEAVEAKAGAKLGASYTLEALQMDNLDPVSGRSKYDLTLGAEVGPGLKLGEFLTYLGLSQVIPLKFTFEFPLGTSPTGQVTADRARYLPGEPVTVDVRLDPATILFPSGFFYNVDQVVVLRKNGLISTETLAAQPASAGQTDFTFTFNSPGLINANELFAFLVPKFLSFVPVRLEVGAAETNTVTVSVQPASVTVAPGGTQQFVATVLGTSSPGVTWSATGGTITPSGLFTAGTTPGPFSVRAFSTADPGAFGGATVTVAAAANLDILVGTYGGQGQTPTIEPAIFTSACTPPSRFSPDALPWHQTQRGIHKSPLWEFKVDRTSQPGILRFLIRFPFQQVTAPAPSFTATVDVTANAVGNRVVFQGAANGFLVVGQFILNDSSDAVLGLNLGIRGAGLPTASCFPYIPSPNPSERFRLGARVDGLEVVSWGFQIPKIR